MICSKVCVIKIEHRQRERVGEIEKMEWESLDSCKWNASFITKKSRNQRLQMFFYYLRMCNAYRFAILLHNNTFKFIYQLLSAIGARHAYFNY